MALVKSDKKYPQQLWLHYCFTVLLSAARSAIAGVSTGVIILVIVGVAVGVISGCKGMSGLMGKAQAKIDGFYPHSILINKSFTRIRKNLDRSPKANSTIAGNAISKGKNIRADNGEYIDTYVQIKDQWGDAVKALGVFRVEVYKYVAASSKSSGSRFAVDGIQELNLSKAEDNMKLWDRVTRSYHLRVKLPPLPYATRAVVMQITFIAKSGQQRLENSIIVDATDTDATK